MFVAGTNIPPRPLPRRRSVILSEAEAVLAWCLDESDYDLVGEVLLAWPLTGSFWSPAATFGFRVLARVEDAVGFLPSAGTRVELLVQAAVALGLEDSKTLRVDTTVVQTDVHHPTDGTKSSAIPHTQTQSWTVSSTTHTASNSSVKACVGTEQSNRGKLTNHHRR
jgi:hypothetical protein